MKHKKYAVINQYGKLAIPLELLEKFCDHAFLVHQSYDTATNKLVVDDIEVPSEFHIVDYSDLQAVLAQQKLSKN